MDEKMITEISRLLGVLESSITALDDETKHSMAILLETIEIKNDEDKRMLYEALDELWLNGEMLLALTAVSEDIGVEVSVLTGLDTDTQQSIVFEHMMGASAEHLRKVIGHEGN